MSATANGVHQDTTPPYSIHVGLGTNFIRYPTHLVRCNASVATYTYLKATAEELTPNGTPEEHRHQIAQYGGRNVLQVEPIPPAILEAEAANPCYTILISDLQRHVLHMALTMLTGNSRFTNNEYKELCDMRDLFGDKAALHQDTTGTLNSFVL